MGSLESGGAEIYIDGNGLSLGLLLHEFGHLFTNGNDSNGDNVPDVFNGKPGIYNLFDSLGTDGMEIAAHNLSEDYSGDLAPHLSASESTANAFAAWILGDFKQNPPPLGGENFTADKASQMVNGFFLNIVYWRTDYRTVPFP
jgi:hypothetical protein